MLLEARSTSEIFKPHVLTLRIIVFYGYNVKCYWHCYWHGDKINWFSLAGEDLFDV